MIYAGYFYSVFFIENKNGIILQFLLFFFFFTSCIQNPLPGLSVWLWQMLFSEL